MDPDQQHEAMELLGRCCADVELWLRELFGELAVSVANPRLFVVHIENEAIFVVVRPWTEDVLIVVQAMIEQPAQWSQADLAYALELNARVPFGAFQLDASGTLHFIDTILGSTCSKHELDTTVLAVAAAAVQYAHTIGRDTAATRLSA